MSVAERHLDPAYASDDLSFVIEQVGAGNYADALQALSRAKAEDARNIYLIALEKQVTRLRNGGILPRERAEIVESLQGLVERARADHRARASSGGSARSPQSSLAPAAEKKDPRVKMIVDQYFRHADEWVRKRDFEAALKEIERVLLVDPENRVAKEYQSRVQQLFRIEHREEDAVFEAPIPAESSAGEADVVAAPGEKKVGKLVIFFSIGIAVIVMVVVGLMFRSTKGQYRVGYMYVSQTPPPPGEEQAVTAAVSAEEPAGGEEAVPETTPEVKPPEEARPKGAAKTSSKPSVAEEVKQKVVEPAPAKAGPSESEPSPKSPAPAAPSAIEQPQRTAEEAAAPSRFIPVEQPPKLVQLQQPNFSDEQVTRGIQGDIVVKVQIDNTGKPLQARVISSTNPSLDAAVVDAILRSSFTPGVMSTGPVTTWMTIPLKLK